MSETRYKVGNIIIDAFLTEDDVNRLIPDKAPVDDNELDELFARWNRTLAYVSGQYAKAKEQVEMVKLKLSVLEATVADEIRQAIIDRKEKVVESRIKSELTLDKRMIEAGKAYAKAIAIEEHMLGVYRAVMRQDKQLDRWTSRIANETRREKRAMEEDIRADDVRQRGSRLRDRMVTE